MPDERDAFDDFEDRPPPHLRRRDDLDDPRWGDERDDYDDGGPRTRPQDRVRPPGVALAVVGWTGLALTVLGLGAALLIGLNNPPPGNELAFNIALGGVLGAIGVAYFAVIGIGGHRMQQCRGYALSLTAAILATASVALFGVCSVVILPFGIWAIVVLSQADVRRAFNEARHP